jgi:hypothetical protein
MKSSLKLTWLKGLNHLSDSLPWKRSVRNDWILIAFTFYQFSSAMTEKHLVNDSTFLMLTIDVCKCFFVLELIVKISRTVYTRHISRNRGATITDRYPTLRICITVQWGFLPHSYTKCQWFYIYIKTYKIHAKNAKGFRIYDLQLFSETTIPSFIKNQLIIIMNKIVNKYQGKLNALKRQK